MINDLAIRPRRNRKSAAIRHLIRETRLSAASLIAPIFLLEGEGKKEAVASMPGIHRLTIDCALQKIESALGLGIQSFLLFSVVPEEKKDLLGSEALSEKALLYRAICAIKERMPETCVIADLALDPFTIHGHDGLLDEHGRVQNDETVEKLQAMALLSAKAGVDLVAPSDMMDGRIAAIRKTLDQARFIDVGILSYTAKYASAFYGPFRNALSSAPKFGDKKSYQMDPANSCEATREALLDEREGADLLMVKPALPYLDVLHQIKQAVNLPVGAYHVSGEYAMIMAAAKEGWIDGPRALYESMLCIKRAGANFIVTYGAETIARCIKEELYD